MLFGGDKNSKDATWKRKYYDSLEQLEVKEKQWSSLETALRHAMSNLSIAVEGVDKDLDQQLDVLRHAIRHGADGNKIVNLVRPITNTIERLEGQRKDGHRVTPASVLETLLDKLDLPKGTARQTRALKKLIDQYDNTSNPKQILDVFSTLLSESFALLANNKKSDNGKENGSPGILGRMFGKSSDGPAVPIESEYKDVTGTDDAALQLATGKETISILLDKILLPTAQKEEQKQFQQKLKSASSEKELSRLAKELALLINELLPQQSNKISASNDYSELTINEILLQLLERLDLSADLQQDMENLQLQLEGDVPEDEWPQILSRFASLIALLRDRANREKKEIEEFLAQLTMRLADLDDHIQSMESDRVDSYKNGRELDTTVKSNVRRIEVDVREAVDVDQLKLLVQQRLDHIGQHMNKFREFEEKRNEVSEYRIKELNLRLQSMEKESNDLKIKVVKERKQALIDSLTGVANRMSYDERIEQEYVHWKRYQSPLSLIVIDIDYFKKINDNYGHMAGDKVLQTLAKLVQKNIRETDLLTRYGGEEFAIIMPDTDQKAAIGVAEKLRIETENCAFHYRDTGVNITISCGVTEFKGQDNPEIVFERADAALYKAKGAGRNRCIPG